MAMGQTEWIDDPDNPVLEAGEPGAWDAAGRYVEGVVWDGSTYHMIFTGDMEDPDDRLAIGHATSADGVTWVMDPNNPVLTRGADGEWDDASVYGGALIYDGGGFHLWYDGFDGEVDRVGYATSPDGSTWTKYVDNPVVDVGPSDSFDELGVWPRSVIVSGGTHRMWYTGVDSPDFFWKVGYAESPDGISWTKHPTPVLEPGSVWDSWDVWDPSVVFDGSMYHMWYSGSRNGNPTGIGYAMSSNGIEWTKHLDNPVIPSSDLWTFKSVVVFDGSTWHMWYHNWDLENTTVVANYATSDCCAGWCCRLFIPAAAVASGAQGAFFQTDVDVSNAGGQATEYQFLWLPRGEDNSEPMTSETFSLGAGKSSRYANVLAEVFDLEPDSLGALAIKSTSPDLLAMSRTYNTPPGEAAGTYGQAIPAIRQEDFIQHGERRRILFGSENAEMRTNIGCQNGGIRTVAVFFDLYSADGTSLGRPFVILDPLGNEQINRIFDGHNPVDGYVDVWTATPDRTFYCYGSVLDNVTSDPTTILPQ
jgi:predicted GH43/DUF377 family glycosyl hydrolase